LDRVQQVGDDTAVLWFDPIDAVDKQDRSAGSSDLSKQLGRRPML